MASRRQMLGTAGSAAAGSMLPGAAGGQRRYWSALTWSCLGFAAGTLFWSATGGDSTMRTIVPVLTPEQTGSITISSAKPADRLPAFMSNPSGKAVRTNCVALVLDRATQEIRPDPCPPGGPELQFAGSSGRQDRLPPLE